MRVHYVMHAFFETPGCIEDWANERGHILTGTQTDNGEALPGASTIDFLIVMGGPQGAMRLDDYPYLRDEIDLISAVVKQNKPVVGFCLGSQLIGEALGARTQKSPEKEVGVFPIQLTEAGERDPILKNLPTEFDVVHWHNDMPGIPQGAALLAQSPGCPHQAFRCSDRVYGFQFHLEPTAQSIKPMLQHAADDLAPSKYTQTAEKILASDFATMNQRLKYILDSIVGLANGAQSSL